MLHKFTSRHCPACARPGFRSPAHRAMEPDLFWCHMPLRVLILRACIFNAVLRRGLANYPVHKKAHDAGALWIIGRRHSGMFQMSNVQACAQWVSFTIKLINFSGGVRSASLDWGKVYKSDDKDHELSADEINKLTFEKDGITPTRLHHAGGRILRRARRGVSISACRAWIRRARPTRYASRLCKTPGTRMDAGSRG